MLYRRFVHENIYTKFFKEGGNMLLKDLLEKLEYKVVNGDDSVEINHLQNDSRKVEKTMFLFALKVQVLTDINLSKMFMIKAQ